MTTKRHKPGEKSRTMTASQHGVSLARACQVFYSVESASVSGTTVQEISPIARKIARPLQPRNDHRKARTQGELTAIA